MRRDGAAGWPPEAAGRAWLQRPERRPVRPQMHASAGCTCLCKEPRHARHASDPTAMSCPVCTMASLLGFSCRVCMEG